MPATPPDLRAAREGAPTATAPATATASASAACASPLLALGTDCLHRCLAWLPDPGAAATVCKALAAVARGRDLAVEWLAAGGGAAGAGSACVGMRAAAWRRLRGRGAAEIARLAIAARRRRRAEAARERQGAAAACAAQAEAEEEGEEDDAAWLIDAGRPCAALLLLGGPYAQHLLIPLAARCGDLALLQELTSSPDIPLRPLLIDGDGAGNRHCVLVTAARAAMRAGRVEAAAFVLKRLLAEFDESDMDGTDPAAEADPFALLRFCCRHGTAECLAALPPLRRAAVAAVARGAPAVLLRDAAAGAAGRVDAEGPAVARALVELLPAGARPGAVWLMLPYGCRGGHAGMQSLMVRLGERHGLMSCLPGQMAHSMAAMREVLAAATACSPPVADDALVQFLRAALQTVLAQPLIEAGQGDTVTSRLSLPSSVPARVWLERRRLERAAGASGASGAARLGAAAAAAAPCSARGDGKARHGLPRWVASLVATGAGAGADGRSADPPTSHILECLEGAHGAAALQAAREMCARAAAGDLGGPGGGGGTWLSLQSRDALPTGAAAAEAAALGEAIVAAASGDTARIARLQAAAAREREAAAAAEAAAGSDDPDEGFDLEPPARHRSPRGSSSQSGPHLAAGGFPSPLDGGYDRMLVAAAKHGRAEVLRQLLPPLLRHADAAQRASRGALLIGVALARRRRGLVRLLSGYGLAAHASEGWRLLQARPLARRPAAAGGCGCGSSSSGGGAPAVAAKARGGAGGVPNGDDDAAAGRACRAARDQGCSGGPEARGDGGAWGEEEEEGGEGEEDEETAVREDARVALSLLLGAEPGTRDERLLHTWLLTGANDGSGRLCGRRVAAVLRAVVAARELPVGARVAAPRALMLRAVLPSADLEVMEAAFAWLERAGLLVE
ncbi:hypothetical protein Rsub_10865 [Raphidocelis subcapitata]|uniref:Uncharacterized protein n=1 Tax=Raphidocelis subcapitata TaxID=307507 RepID=A0A2V0PE36_9CHLO|nr:hypothetical protein Rsub_10865 [Raphidocelis subcapitata]|eukprot:GBF98118.1 hypothetical protein Rsub_10865 [Raphidocelis subcapitata]